jgi:hypothetical protein
MPELLLVPAIICACTAALAGVVRGFAGFGAAMILTPVFSAFYGPTVGVPVCLLVEFCISFPLLRQALPLVDWRQIATLLLAAAMGVPLGVWLLAWADPAPMRWAISGIVLGAVLLLASGWRYTGKPVLAGTLTAGAASGFLNGLAGMAGPPVAFYYLAGASAAATIRASFIVYFAAVDLVALLGLGARGLMTLQALMLAAILVLPYIGGGLIGERLFKVASEAFFRRLALVILTVVAVAAPFL